MRDIYGFIGYHGDFVDVGFSETGAKLSANRYESVQVGYRSSINNMYIPTSLKIDGKWIKTQ